MVLSRCAIVRIVQSANSCTQHDPVDQPPLSTLQRTVRIVCWIRLSVSMSHAAVASSSTRIYTVLRMAQQHTNMDPHLGLAQHCAREAHELSLPNAEVLACVTQPLHIKSSLHPPPSDTRASSFPSSFMMPSFRWLTSSARHSFWSSYLQSLTHTRLLAYISTYSPNGSRLDRIEPENSTGSCRACEVTTVNNVCMSHFRPAHLRTDSSVPTCGMIVIFDRKSSRPILVMS